MGSQFRGLLMLLGAAFAVSVAIGLLGRLVTPVPVPELVAAPVPAGDAPSGSTTTNPETPVENHTPTVGGTLEITGDRTDILDLINFSLDNNELSGVGGRLSFSGSGDAGTIFIDHLVFEDLDIYLKPDDCSISAGDINVITGIVPTEISCEGITDIRDKATIDVKGTLALPGEVVKPIRSDLPPMGGTVTVTGDYTLTITSGDTAASDGGTDTFVGGGEWVVFESENPQFAPTPPTIELANYQTKLEADGSTIVTGTGISVVQTDDTLWVARIFDDAGTYDLRPEDCPVEYQQVGVLGMFTTLQALSIDCPDVTVDGLGTVTITGEFNIVRRVISLH